MDHPNLFFTYQPQLRKKQRKTKISFPASNIYTSVFQPSQLPTNHTSSRLSLDSSQPRNHLGFVNPKLNRVTQIITFNQVQQPQRRVFESSKLQELQAKVSTLRRTVSHNKIRSESKLNDMAIRAQRLKQKYLQQNRRLGEIVHAINRNIP